MYLCTPALCIPGSAGIQVNTQCDVKYCSTKLKCERSEFPLSQTGMVHNASACPGMCTSVCLVCWHAGCWESRGRIFTCLNMTICASFPKPGMKAGMETDREIDLSVSMTPAEPDSC